MRDAHHANQPPVVEERRDLCRQVVGVAGRDEIQVVPRGVEQQLQISEVRQDDENECQRGQDGKQGVISHGAGEQQTLVGAKPRDGHAQETQRVFEHEAHTAGLSLHDGVHRSGGRLPCVSP